MIAHDSWTSFGARAGSWRKEQAHMSRLSDAAHWLSRLLPKRHAEAAKVRARVFEQERLLAALSEHMEGGFALLDRDLRFRYLSEGYARFFQRPADELIGLRMDELLDKAAFEVAHPYALRALAGETVHYENHLVSSVGGDSYSNVTCLPERAAGGEVTGIITVVQIVTAFKKTELALSESRELLLKAQAIANISCWTFDLASLTFTPVGRLQTPMTNLPARANPKPFNIEQLIGVVHPDDLDRVRRAWFKAAAGEAEFDIEFRILRAGEVRWIRTQAQFQRDAQGHLTGALGARQDVTDRKRVEQEIKSLNVELEQRVARRTAELTLANEELESFAYAVAHDLRSPLRALSGFSQTLLDPAPGETEAERRDKLERIRNASQKMASLIDGLLELARHSRKELRAVAVDVSEIARRVLAELRQQDVARSIEVQIEDGLELFGDAHLIEALLRNLLENAWKYTARRSEALIRVYAERSEGQFRLCVADNGAGFDMAYAVRLFKPFSRLHGASEFPGVGIGLATAQRIARRHGWQVGGEGAPDKGATFFITVPLVPAQH
jgi:PAS domain S-box-containing protein